MSPKKRKRKYQPLLDEIKRLREEIARLRAQSLAPSPNASGGSSSLSPRLQPRHHSESARYPTTPGRQSGLQKSTATKVKVGSCGTGSIKRTICPRSCRGPRRFRLSTTSDHLSSMQKYRRDGTSQSVSVITGQYFHAQPLCISLTKDFCMLGYDPPDS